MNTKPLTTIVVLFTLISSGCLGIIEDINNDIDNGNKNDNTYTA